jgi:prepilin-type N-terminal cleavage/methylation domain-containing protein
MTHMKWALLQKGFTIVELLIVIVIIAILAAITIVAYNGIQGRAVEAGITADLQSNTQKLEQDKILGGSDNYEPDAITKYLTTTGNHSTVEYVYGSKSTFCFQATGTRQASQVYYVHSNKGITSVTKGACPSPSGSASARCIAGQVHITMTQLNDVGQNVTMNFSTAYGSYTVSANTGSSGSFTTNSRLASIPKALTTVTINSVTPGAFNDIRYYVLPAFSC